jgi:hypothetical protein
MKIESKTVLKFQPGWDRQLRLKSHPKTAKTTIPGTLKLQFNGHVS